MTRQNRGLTECANIAPHAPLALEVTVSLNCVRCLPRGPARVSRFFWAVALVSTLNSVTLVDQAKKPSNCRRAFCLRSHAVSHQVYRRRIETPNRHVKTRACCATSLVNRLRTAHRGRTLTKRSAWWISRLEKKMTILEGSLHRRKNLVNRSGRCRRPKRRKASRLNNAVFEKRKRVQEICEAWSDSSSAVTSRQVQDPLRPRRNQGTQPPLLFKFKAKLNPPHLRH